MKLACHRSTAEPYFYLGRDTIVRKIWLESYPSGVKPEIDMSRFASINDVFTASCREFGQAPAFRNMGTTITYADLDRLSRNFAAFLQSMGMPRGTRIALMLPNLLQYPVSLFGILRAGMIAVNVNPLYTVRELEHQLKDSGAEAIVVLENFAHVVEKALPNTSVQHVIVTGIGDLFPAPRCWVVNLAVKHVKKMVPAWRIDRAIRYRSALKAGAHAPLDEAHPEYGDIALLQYTGGTTGTAKGAILTHGNLVANVLQATAWWEGRFESGKEVAIAPLPLYHIMAFTILLFCMRLGAMSVLITNPRDLAGFVAELKKLRFSIFTGVNTLFNGLMNTPGFEEIDFKQAKLVFAGGASVHRAVAERFQAMTGQSIVEGYGLTETSPLVASNLPGSRYTGTVGLPVPSTEISIRDHMDRELEPGGEGEICVRGPQVTHGYWQRPEETALVITPDGFFHTGDIGVLDQRGFLRITDRKKDMISVSGFKVFPSEVEGVIAGIPGVVECGVIGVPDPIGGEIVKAYVRANSGDVSADSIIAHCRKHLTSYKVPKLVEFRDELPKSPIGKVLRRELRKLHQPSSN